LGLGASAIAGTTIAIVDPLKRERDKSLDLPAPPSQKLSVSAFDLLKLNRLQPELTELLQKLGQKNGKLDANYLFVDLASGEYAAAGIDRSFPAASTIKLPILLALFQDIEQQKVRWDEQLTIDKESIAEGSGELQERSPGMTVSVLEAATKMIKISDNTATNLLIDRLGGKLALNDRFREWGLKTTVINDRLPDLAGKNLTTVSELSRTLVAIERGKIVSDASRRQILEMMSNTSGNTMLPRGLGKDAKIAHKTGDIGTAIADVGTIELPSGKIYLATVMLKRPHNDPAGPELVRQMSKTAYQHFLKPQP
jgi:beta-lactamase class A